MLANVDKRVSTCWYEVFTVCKDVEFAAMQMCANTEESLVLKIAAD